MTLDQARKICLALEGAYESSHFDHPDFRVKKGIFATLWPKDNHSVLRLPLDMAQSIAAENPNTRIASKSGSTAWLSVDLKSMKVNDYRSLAETAWQFRNR